VREHNVVEARVNALARGLSGDAIAQMPEVSTDPPL
jgi:hypothetical protein